MSSIGLWSRFSKFLNLKTETMDGAWEDDGNIRLNPFMQPPILKALFGQLPAEDLSNCRLVNKLWYKESLLTWRSNATLKFNWEGLVCTREDGSKRPLILLREFLHRWQAGEWASCPFKTFNLCSWNFTVGDVEQERFMELVGGHVTSLTLGYCSFVGRDNFRRIIYQAFPNLQFLKIEYCRVDKDDYWQDPAGEILAYQEPAFGVHGLKSLDISDCRPDSLMNLLSHFHKLKSLRLRSVGQMDYLDLLETIRLVRTQDRTKLPLTNFDFKFVFDLEKDRASSIQRLQLHEQLNLPLQRLDIRTSRNEENENATRDLLQYHSSALIHLTFLGNDRQGLCDSFPVGVYLKKLEELAIQTPRLSDNLNYLRYTPNLRALDIVELCSLSMSQSDKLFSNSEQLEIGDWTLPSLTHLSLQLPLSLCNLKKLTKWMPNVDRLSVSDLDDIKFSVVCNNWKNLKYLVDYGTELTDEGVIGIEKIHRKWLWDGQSVPNITKLKKLDHFRTCSSKLTSASVREGFLKLADLTWLALGRLTKLDDETKAALKTQKVKLYM